MHALDLTHYTLTSALGAGVAAQREALHAEHGGLVECTPDILAGTADIHLPACVGRVDGLDAIQLPESLCAWDCRNNRLAWLGLQQDDFLSAIDAARERYGADRIGVFMGTSTSGVNQTELAYRAVDADGQLPDWYSYRHTQNCFSVGDFTRTALALAGPALVISTACSSSAKVFASASRYIEAGLIDAAVVGGVDSLCLTTLYGFSALQLVSPEPCRPADNERRGISIGEAAGFALLERGAEAGVWLSGYGESSDAYHMSSPHPEGAGAVASMRAALARAGLQPGDIDYINLHGTATPANDLSEGRGVFSLFGAAVPGSSTKGWIGHCLGAAGIAEVVFSAIAIEDGFMPGSLNTRQVDPAIPNRILLHNESAPVRRVLSNSFGFGGSNCSLVLEARA